MFFLGKCWWSTNAARIELSTCLVLPGRQDVWLMPLAKNKRKRVRNYAKLLCANGNPFCVQSHTPFHFSRLSISRFSWCCCHFCAAIKVDVRSLQAFNTSQRVQLRVECDMQTLLTRLNQNGPHSPSVTLIIRNFTFDWRVHPRSHKHTQYTRTSDAAE